MCIVYGFINLNMCLTIKPTGVLECPLDQKGSDFYGTGHGVLDSFYSLPTYPCNLRTYTCIIIRYITMRCCK